MFIVLDVRTHQAQVLCFPRYICAFILPLEVKYSSHLLDSTRKPNAESILTSLGVILSASTPNDDISDELAQLIGFDDIELVIKIIENRAAVLKEVSLVNYSCTNLTYINQAIRNTGGWKIAFRTSTFPANGK